MEDWNEPRLVLAVARAGSLTKAAKTLGIDHSTVFRRLNALEERLGVRFFERLPGGAYQATAAGERMAAAAERIEDEAIALERDLIGRDYRLAGRLRVTSSETLAYCLLTREIASFREAHPGIMVELVIDNRFLSLSRREADVALRPMRPKEGDLWGRKLADVAWTVYGSRAYLNENGFPSSAAELACHALVCWDENAVGIGAADWLASVAPEDRITYRTTSDASTACSSTSCSTRTRTDRSRSSPSRPHRARPRTSSRSCRPSISGHQSTEGSSPAPLQLRRRQR